MDEWEQTVSVAQFFADLRAMGIGDVRIRWIPSFGLVAGEWNVIVREDGRQVMHECDVDLACALRQVISLQREHLARQEERRAQLAADAAEEAGAE